MKKSFIIFVIIIVFSLLVGRFLKVNGYIQKDFFYQSLVKLKLIKPCFKAHTNIMEIFAQEGFDYDEADRQAVSSSLAKLTDANIIPAEQPKIPQITHRIYFISKLNPPVLNNFYLEAMKLNFTRLNILPGEWQHYVWTNDLTLIPAEISAIKGVKVKLIDEFSDHPLYKILLEILEKGQTKKPYLAEAADLFRLMAVQRLGGIYMDMDYEIYNPASLFDLMKKFDLLVGREKPSQRSLYGNAFIAAKANHPILNEALMRALRNRDINDNSLDYIKYPCSGYDELYFNGPPLITVSYFAKNNIDGNMDVVLPSWMIFNLNFARYKNAIHYYEKQPQESDLTKRFKKFFRLSNEKHSDPICDYNAIAKEDMALDPLQIGALLKKFSVDIKEKDLQKYYELENGLRSEDNIYYNLKDKEKFPVIGADMFCGSWTSGGKVFKRKYYWDL
jgi:hypothetical protein